MKAGELIRKSWDLVSEKTGLVMIPDRPVHPRTPDVTTLEIKGYRQVDSFSCGAVVGMMLVHTWHPDVSIDHFFDLCNPDPERGTTTAKLANALRKSGVGVSVRRNLTWSDIRTAINKGSPIAVLVKRETCDHWVLLYGVGVNPKRVFIAGNSFPRFGRKEYAWSEFVRIWANHDDSLICWGKPFPRETPERSQRW